MKHAKWLFLGTAVFALTACSQYPAEEMASYADSKLETDVGDSPQAANAPADINLPQIAYDYAYGFSAPSASLPDLVAKHQSACEKAGAGACLLISSSAAQNPEDRYTAYDLELRVSPAWLKQFQTGLEADLKGTKGSIARHSVTSEDLSLNIVDTEARLNNKLALRDRLQEIIRQRPGKISELIEAETQLAQVQADIDAAQSALAVMKKRVATVRLTLNYQSEAVAASTSSFSPITDALNNVVRNFMWTLGLLIQLMSALLPVLLIGIPAVYYGRKWWLKRRKPKASVETPPPPKSPEVS
ncbi:MAG: DUF4349 domain-containing protein [Asticcacaulis sp.]